MIMCPYVRACERASIRAFVHACACAFVHVHVGMSSVFVFVFVCVRALLFVC